jgi:DNA-binding transcriptional LysR family regulator
MDRLLPKIDTYHLMIFYYVAKEKSINMAAKKLFLSQPTVSNHIKSLERSAQLKLIRTDGNKLTLTCMGESLFQYAKEILHSALAADRFAEIARNSSLNIGFCSLFVHVASDIINDMSEQHDQPAKVNVRFEEPHILVEGIINSRIDIAIIPNLDDGLSNLNRVKIADGVTLTFYCSPIHPIFRNRILKWTDLGAYPLVIGTEFSFLTKMVTDKLIFEGLKKPPKFYFTSYNIEFFKNIVRNGNLISIALKKDIEDELEKGILKAISLPDELCLNIYAVANKPIISTPIAKQLISNAIVTFSDLELFNRKKQKLLNLVSKY